MPLFPAALATPILTPTDPRWDDARKAWNLAVDQRPAAIAAWLQKVSIDPVAWIADAEAGAVWAGGVGPRGRVWPGGPGRHRASSETPEGTT